MYVHEFKIYLYILYYIIGNIFRAITTHGETKILALYVIFQWSFALLISNQTRKTTNVWNIERTEPVRVKLITGIRELLGGNEEILQCGKKKI